MQPIPLPGSDLYRCGASCAHFLLKPLRRRGQSRGANARSDWRRLSHVLFGFFEGRFAPTTALCRDTATSHVPFEFRQVRRNETVWLVGLGISLLASAAYGQLPPNWADQDIGSPSQSGSASYANGSFSVSGG